MFSAEFQSVGEENLLIERPQERENQRGKSETSDFDFDIGIREVAASVHDRQGPPLPHFHCQPHHHVLMMSAFPSLYLFLSLSSSLGTNRGSVIARDRVYSTLYTLIWYVQVAGGR